MELTEEEIKTAKETSQNILENYTCTDRGKIIPVLQNIQNELGYVPLPAMQTVSDHFELPAVDIYSIVTFYNQFRLIPPGKNQVKVCMGTACHMRGGQIILDSWERRLDIKCGETTEDREFSLERVACVGCCTLAPVVVMNEEIHGKVTPTRVDGLLYSYQLDKEQEEGEEQEQKAGEENE
ncbi:MAG: NAD(P)H-dependent oxidoreductase subunit E [Clostridiales bacterium]|nr:NAD(P)H-dependent oxidoreductase subunit E [Clostridiales bacterium]MCF8021920.1 NAD(P)H-dependent oxidoreductase subunit E [Clostridiales bacterium]